MGAPLNFSAVNEELITALRELTAEVRKLNMSIMEAQPYREERKREAAAETGPECPICGGEMKLKANRATKEKFWGCVNYPACKGIRPI